MVRNVSTLRSSRGTYNPLITQGSSVITKESLWDRSREFLNKQVNNHSLTANDGGGAISINSFKISSNEKSKV
jgi:hypothetical protein